jgi:hypothetical protein
MLLGSSRSKSFQRSLVFSQRRSGTDPTATSNSTTYAATSTTYAATSTTHANSSTNSDASSNSTESITVTRTSARL